MRDSRKENSIDKKVLKKLQNLPNSKKAEVLDFVEYLSIKSQREKGTPSIYSYTSGLVKGKHLKKMSLREIEAIVHEVRGVEG